MKLWKWIGPLLLLPPFAGCAARPAYFGDDARLLRQNGAQYWEASAETASYLRVRMRRRRVQAAEATEYAGTLSLASSAPVVMRSTFTLAEGASASFHYDFNDRVDDESAQSGKTLGFIPAALDVVVACAQGKCWADSKLLDISPEGRVELKAATLLAGDRGARKGGDARDSAAEALVRDGECAALHDRLNSLRDRDASSGKVRRDYEEKGCAAWLEEHGGVGAAWRRVRVAKWTTIGGS